MGAKQCGGIRKEEEESYIASLTGKQSVRRLHNPNSKQNDTGNFGRTAVAVQVALIVCLFFTDYDFVSHSVFDGTFSVTIFKGIMMMLLVGFGYLRCFLKYYGLGAVGFTFFMTALGLQWSMLVKGWMENSTMYLSFDMTSFIAATAAVAATVISFGALLGKISPLQVLLLTLIEVTCFHLNTTLFLASSHLVPTFSDVGGAISVQVFGAYFGLAASVVYGGATVWHDKENNVAVDPEQVLTTSYFSEIISSLGTTFLWISCPSLIAGSQPLGSAAQKLAIMNTLFALLGSSVIVFAVSSIKTQRLLVAPVRNSTIAGAVAIGAVANVRLGPGKALLIGVLGGIVSCLANIFQYPSAKYDSSNIHGVHGLPGVFGGLISALLPLIMPQEVAFTSLDQLLGLFGTIGIGCVAGACTGGILKCFPRPEPACHDDAYWDTEHLDGWSSATIASGAGANRYAKGEPF